VSVCHRDVAAYFKGNEGRATCLYIVYYTNYYFQYAEWQFEIRISICTNDILFCLYFSVILLLAVLMTIGPSAFNKFGLVLPDIV